MLETSTLQNNGKSLLYQPNALGCDPQPDWAQNLEFEQDAFAPEKPRHSIEQPLRGPDGCSRPTDPQQSSDNSNNSQLNLAGKSPAKNTKQTFFSHTQIAPRKTSLTPSKATMKDKPRDPPPKSLQSHQGEGLSVHSQKPPPIPGPESDSKKTGRWTMDEHFRFIEALQQYGKEWKRVQMHVGSRSSTQARSHAQKFFVKLEKRGQRLDDFLSQIDLEGVRQRMMEAGSDQDYEDPDNYNLAPVKKPSPTQTASQPPMTTILPNVSISRLQEATNKSQS